MKSATFRFSEQETILANTAYTRDYMIDSRIDGPAWSYTNAKDKTDYFSWSDDEVELLLTSIMDYKTLKEMDNIDWESCQSKYQDIHNKFVEHPTPEEAKAFGKEYPHSRTRMMKAILTSKLKTIRQKYRLADNDGRRSGHGRVVLFYFKLRKQIWGDSPASTNISSGIETTELSEMCTDSEEMSPSISSTPRQF